MNIRSKAAKVIADKMEVTDTIYGVKTHIVGVRVARQEGSGSFVLFKTELMTFKHAEVAFAAISKQFADKGYETILECVR